MGTERTTTLLLTPVRDLRWETLEGRTKTSPVRQGSVTDKYHRRGKVTLLLGLLS